jgi:hypothetical protein
MAKEMRQIALDAEEMILALRALRTAQPHRVPPGQIHEIRGEAEGGVTIAVKHRDDFGPLHGDHQVPAETVREAMIRFCLENNIPLPLRGQKSAVCVGGEFVLQIQLESELLTGINYSSDALARFKGAAPRPALRSVNGRA